MHLIFAVAALAAWGQDPQPESQQPTSLAQFQSNGTTALAVGGNALTTTVVISGTVNGTVDPTPPRHALQVEIRPASEPLTGTMTHQAVTLVTVGQTSTVTVAGLSPGVAYHWQARTWKT